MSTTAIILGLGTVGLGGVGLLIWWLVRGAETRGRQGLSIEQAEEDADAARRMEEVRRAGEPGDDVVDSWLRNE